MAVYKIFPNKDAFIDKANPTMNTGKDSILMTSYSTYSSSLSSSLYDYQSYYGVDYYDTDSLNKELIQTQRILLSFDNKEIQDLKNLVIPSGSNISYFLRLYTANAYNLDQKVSFKIHNIPSGSFWSSGLGHYGDVPNNTYGVSWNFLDGLNAWPSPDTSSQGGNSNGEGGIWNLIPSSSKDIGIYDNTDINLDITDHVNQWNSVNNGLICFISSDENNYASRINYFSRDTNSIYPPCLDIKWDDSDYTGQITSSITTEEDIIISINENPGVFYPGSVNKFRVNCNPKFPKRLYQTSSLYVSNNYLPLNSTYAIKDMSTNEYVVDFDDVFTKLGADEKSNYFTLYMNGFEPERYYQIIIKYVTPKGKIVIHNNNYNFKIVNG